MKTPLIVLALTLLLGLVAIFGLRRDGPALTAESDGTRGPWFSVRVVKPRSAQPLFGIFPSRDLGFDSASPNARPGRVADDRLELIADDYDLSIVIDGADKIGAGTRLILVLELGGKLQRLRCRPADPAIGEFRSTTEGDGGDFEGDFRIELPICENAETGWAIEWPPRPLTVIGSFKRMQKEVGNVQD